MKLQYLGTAAAEGIPAIFCECETCKKARAWGGKNIRTRTQAIVDDALSIDFPADTYFHSIVHGIDFTNIHDYIITHTHSDHFYASEMHNFFPGMANIPDTYVYNFYGSAEMNEMATGKITSANGGRWTPRIQLHALEPFVTRKIGDFNVTALPADHGAVSPFVYLVERDSKTLLWGHDTGYFHDEVWAYFEKTKPQINILSLDATWGSVTGKTAGHMGMDTCAKIRDRLSEMGCVDSDTKAIVNHFSHNVPGVLYEESEAEAVKYGMHTSYDGMIVEA